ncbi:MAG: pyruvate kinase [Clostridia bacterium]|nr:pyruvate kinase [Clostridia bacterium]
MRKTKIICTLGPSTDDEAVLESMIRAGMNVARLNFSHGTREEHERRLDMVKRLRARLGVPVALMIDTRGPDVRICRFDNHFIELTAGAEFILTSESCDGNCSRVGVTYRDLPQSVSPGETILLDDGLIRLRVREVRGCEIVCTVEIGGILADNKSLHVPGRSLSIPFMRENDLRDLEFAARSGFDYIAASFVRSPADVLEIRAVLENHGARDIRIIAKIENAEGVANADSILGVSDGVMVARGDLGVEVDYVEIPSIQKDLIKQALARARISVVATQMLESMIVSPRPTRAEISDVANAIYDGTSAIMLSGETAVGRFPVEAVQAMANIAERTERDIDYRKRFAQIEQPGNRDITDAISHATCSIAHHLGAAAIVTPTQTGTTAMSVSRYRPSCPIVACTPETKVYHQLALSWGVVPYRLETAPNDDVLQFLAVRTVRESGLVETGDVIITTAGIPLGVSGTTNTIRVSVV